MTKSNYPDVTLNEDVLYLPVIVEVCKETMKEYVYTYLDQYGKKQSLEMQKERFTEKLGTTDIEEIAEIIKTKRIEIREMTNDLAERRITGEMTPTEIATIEEEITEKNSESSGYISHYNLYHSLTQEMMTVESAIKTYEQKLLDLKRYAMKHK